MIAGALLANAKKAEKEGRKSSLRVLVCGTSHYSPLFSPPVSRLNSNLHTCRPESARERLVGSFRRCLRRSRYPP